VDKHDKISQSRQMVSFRLGPEEFGVDILKVREIVRLQPVVKLPETPDFIEGIINLRGNVIPIIDLKKKLALGEVTRDNLTRIMVLSVEDNIMGVLVDRVEQVLRVAENEIQPPPDIGSGQIKNYIDGVGKLDDTLLLMLNVDKILTENEMIRLDELQKMKDMVQKTDNPDDTSNKEATKTSSQKSGRKKKSK